jgi:hypothetical protein
MKKEMQQLKEEKETTETKYKEEKIQSQYFRECLRD